MSPESKERIRQKHLNRRAKPSQWLGDPEWQTREDWQPFGDRLDFLSDEERHLTTGRLTILPPNA